MISTIGWSNGGNFNGGIFLHSMIGALATILKRMPITVE